MTDLLQWITDPLALGFMQRALLISLVLRHHLRGALLLAHADGLVADG